MKETEKKFKVPRTRRFVHFLCFCGILALVAAGCSLPQAPGDLSWDTHLVIPLGITTYGLNSLVEADSVLQIKGSGVGMDTSGYLYFSAYTKVQVPVGDSLIMEPTSKAVDKPSGVPNYNGDAELPNRQNRLTRGAVAEGSLSVSLHNLSGTSSDTVQVTIPGFTSNSGDTLVLTFRHLTSTVQTQTQDLHNYWVTPGPLVNGHQSLALRIRAPQADNIHMDAQLGRLSFIHYWGTVDSMRVNGLEASSVVDSLPTGWNAIHPTTVDAFVHMHGNSALNMTSNLNLSVSTYLHSGLIAMHPLHSPALNLASDTVVVVHDLADMIATYPDRMAASASLMMFGSAEDCSGSDTVNLNVELRSPLSFTLDRMHAPGDDQIDTVDNSSLKDIEQNGSKAIIRIWNHLPVGGRVYLVADSVRNNVLSTSHAHVDTLVNMAIPMPTVDAHGNVIADAMTVDTLNLDSVTVRLMKNPPFYTRTDVTLNSSNGDTMVANANDYVKVQIIADIQRHVSSKGND